MKTVGAGPLAEWLTSSALLRRAGVSLVRILVADMAPLIRPSEAASHTPQLEGPTTKNTQLCTGGLWGEKGKDLKQKRRITV